MSIREVWTSGTHLPVAVSLLGILATGLLLRWFYHRSFPGSPARHLWWLRFAGVAIVLLALTDLTSRSFSVQLPELVVVVDQSTSMSLPLSDETSKTRNPTRTRIEEVNAVFGSERLAYLKGRYRLSFWKLGVDATPLAGPDSAGGFTSSFTAEDSASRLGEGLLQVLENQAGKQTAAIVLFSDGAVTEGRSLAEIGMAAGQQSLPVFAVGLGSPHPAPNLSLENLTANRRVQQNQPLTVNIQLLAESMNRATGQIVAVDVSSGQELLTQDFPITSDSFRTGIPLRLRLKTPGNRTLMFTVTSTVEESNLTDNQQTLGLQVVTGPTRILILQDFPSPWFRFLKETLTRAIDPDTRNPAFQVDTFLQQASPEFAKIDVHTLTRFPAVNELADYDLIILGDARMDSVGLDQGLTDVECEALESYVRNQSGNLVVVPGPRHVRQWVNHPLLGPFLPLDADSLPEPVSTRTYRFEFHSAADLWPGDADPTGGPPVEVALPGRFHIFPVDLGAQLYSTVAEFRDEDAGDEEATRPAIIWQRIGSGNVITHFSDELYKLRFRSDAAFYEQYWNRLVQRLAAERLQKRDLRALIQTDADHYERGQQVSISAEIFDSTLKAASRTGLALQMSNEAGHATSIDLTPVAGAETRFQATIMPARSGTYRLKLSMPADDGELAETRFTVRDTQAEWSILNQQTGALQELADRSSGIYLPAEDLEELWGRLPRGRWNQTGPVTKKPLWSYPAVPFLFALGLTTVLLLEWILRRRMRLE